MLSNVAHELNDADERILDTLAGGRNLPQNIARELDYSRQYVQNRLQMLKAADYVKNVGGGLYELVDDPREDADADTVDVPDAGYDEVRLFVEDSVWIAHHLDTDTEASGATKVDALRAIIKAFADQDNI